ncbi:PAC2 family protein [Kocuria coralli]|uniref:PAC2 family protein n=1 Tax=Kocuria coralli TaxID=1461025 RepID=A0A5J5KUN2_9MICC|nr:PAC2 family protein [Kocuria coralli]KAA9393427.1 PAC2 family protein [Kocuria coralli]
MVDPSALYLGNPSLLDDPRLHGAPMVISLSGYAEGGQISDQIRETLLESLPHDVLARFDADQLQDYRSRRPHVRFVEDHFERMENPQLALYALTDPLGRSFSLLTGPEPDLQWNRFIEAVVELSERLQTSMVTTVTGIPMPVPHTRPFLVSVHGTRTDLVEQNHGQRPVAEMSSSVAQQLEIRFGELGVDTIGFTVHVPQYLADARLPQITVTAFEHASAATGLTLPTDALRDAGGDVIRRVDEQVAGSPEVQAVIESMEVRYDEVVANASQRSLLAGDESELPDADEIGAAVEAFLANQPDDD